MVCLHIFYLIRMLYGNYPTSKMMAANFFLRRMLRISWTEKKSNLEVLRATADANEGSLSKCIEFPGSVYEKAWSREFSDLE